MGAHGEPSSPAVKKATDWSDPPLPSGQKRTYLSGVGALAVTVAWLLFLASLLAYFSSSTSWAPW